MAKGSNITRNRGALARAGVANGGGYERMLNTINSRYGSDFGATTFFKKLNVGEQNDFRKWKASIIGTRDAGDTSFEKVTNNVRQSGRIETVKTDDLLTAQSNLDRETVARYAARKDYDGVLGLKVSGTDKVILIDGNHRAAAAIVNGQKEIQVKIKESVGDQLFKGIIRKYRR